MPEETWLNDYVFVVRDFLTPEECAEHIRFSEDVGYEEALINTDKGTRRITQYRNNDRVIFKDESLAEKLWERAEDFIPAELEERNPVGVNELFRFYRYTAGQKFDWHIDLPFERDNGEKSLLTFMIYLNQDCEGGATSFEDSYSQDAFDEFSVTPQTGMALFFEHEIHHKGEPVSDGTKYVLRTDIMFSALEDDELADHKWDQVED